MSDQPEDRKPDLSNFPRGAISIKGLPVSRNARLPSIRVPRDLTLGTQPKRTFTPNIPVRREKRAPEPKLESSKPVPSNVVSPSKGERGRARGKGRGRELIQTEGALFEKGIATASKERSKEPSFGSSGISGGRSSSSRKIKAGARMVVSDQDMDTLLRDDFIDDGSDEDEVQELAPVLYPYQEKDKNTPNKKVKKENSNQDFNSETFAKEMGFDVQRISKYIKKEKTEEVVTKPAVSNIPDNDITNLFANEGNIFLIKIPHGFSARLEDHLPKISPSEAKPSTEPDTLPLSALPDGKTAKIQILKSGKARLVMGSLRFQLDYAKNLPTGHKVCSLKTDTDPGDMSLITNLDHLLNVTPDILGGLSSLNISR